MEIKLDILIKKLWKLYEKQKVLRIKRDQMQKDGMDITNISEKRARILEQMSEILMKMKSHPMWLL
jgi:hypothetical protein